ncbi:MAG TPA: hypothetical protein VIK16_04550, partial [Candidatus Limnocylindrales bacterium]
QLAAMHRSVPHLPPLEPANQAELTPGADSATTIAGGTPTDVTAEPMMADSAAGAKGDVE